MPFISAENLIQGYPIIMPETVNLIRWFYSQFNNRSAANRTIVNVEPLFYQNAYAGSEFLSYAATKLYLCFHFHTNSSGAGAGTTSQYTQLYDEANTARTSLSNSIAFYNTSTPAVNYFNNNVELKNFYFSRITSIGVSAIIFNGYRITLA